MRSGMMWIILRYLRHLSLDVLSQFVAITVAIRRNSRSTDFDQIFGAVPPIILLKLCEGIINQARLKYSVQSV